MGKKGVEGESGHGKRGREGEGKHWGSGEQVWTAVEKEEKEG